MEENTQNPGAEDHLEPQNDEVLDESNTPKPKKKKNAVKEVEAIAPAADNEAAEEKIAKEETSEKSDTEQYEDREAKDYTGAHVEELIEVFKELSTRSDWLKNHSEIQKVNQLFEEKFRADLEAVKKKFIKEGGNEIDFFYKPEYKTTFDQLGFEYRKNRRKHYKEQEAAQKVNAERKKTIIEEIKGLIGADENINTIYNKFRTLQESWYSTGPVPRAENQNLWETFKHHVERFYDFLHLNRELRELDFKHNYEEKLKIIEQAEALKETPDIMRATRDLNTLHKLWKNDLGPVAKEHREALWKRFQEATKVIQQRRQEYQKDIAGAMKANLEKKKELLQEMRQLTEQELSNHNAWQKGLKRFNELRATFKTIGYVPTKESKQTWQEFRDIGRTFMRQKNIFYKNQKKEYNTNITSKKELIAQSKENLEDAQWNSKVQEMKDIQKEWKSIGFVPRKLDNKLWEEFSEIHKTFFDRIKSGYQHLTDEQEALQKEKIKQIDAVNAKQFSGQSEKVNEALTALWDNWSKQEKIGGQTDIELNKKFIAKLKKVVKELDLDKKTLKEVQFKIEALVLQHDPDKLQQQLNEINATINKLKGERAQLENNLEFFTDSSAENPLYKNVEKQIKSCQTKIDKAQEEYIRLKQIKNANQKLENQEKEALNKGEETQDSDAE